MKLLKEFRDFINRGNVMNLAVAVIIGAAFTAIINSIVGDLITPLISLLTRGVDYSSMEVVLGEGPDAAALKYGMLIQAVINFILVAFVVFLLIKLINKMTRKKEAEEVPKKPCPFCCEDIPEEAVRCPNCTTILEEGKVPDHFR